jgi:hypothetical protein
MLDGAFDHGHLDRKLLSHSHTYLQWLEKKIPPASGATFLIQQVAPDKEMREAIEPEFCFCALHSFGEHNSGSTPSVKVFDPNTGASISPK